MVIVLIHTIIDDLCGDESKVLTIVGERKTGWFTKGAGWKIVAKVGLPTVYVMAALGIVLPGVIKIMIPL